MPRTCALAILSMLVACSTDPAADSPDENGGSGAAVQPPGAAGSDPGGASGTSGAPGQTPANVPARVRVHYPAGSKTIGLEGERAPLDPAKPKPLAKGPGDTWELEVGVLTAPLSVTPTLDDVRARGPAYVVRPGATLDIYPHFVATKGTVSARWPAFTSQKRAGTTRAVRTYLPPSYEENSVARYPVVYVHDGQYAFSTGGPAQTAIAGTMRIDVAMNDGIDSGAVAEAIVVAVDNSSDLFDVQGKKRIVEMTPTADPEHAGSGKASEYVAMILDEIKPMVDKDLRTRPDRASTYMMGSSLGGLVSAYAASARGDVVGAFASMSGSIWWDDHWIVGETKKSVAGPNKPLRVYVDYGETEQSEPTQTDMLVAPTNAFLKVHTDAGFVKDQTLAFVLGAKGQKHDNAAWAARMPGALSFLVGRGR